MTHRSLKTIASLGVLLAAACGQKGNEDASGGAPGNGGKAAQSGGASTGGGSSGGASMANGGTSSGGSVSSAGGSLAGGTTSTGAGGASRGGANGNGGTGGNASRGGATASGGAAGSGSSGAPSGGSAGAGSDVIATIRTGVVWNDTAGNRIEAHGGGFLLVGDTWYWVGEDKSHNAAQFKAVNLYASRDLEHWEFKKAILTTKSTSALAAADRIIERPKIIYNETTKKFVLWMHWEGKNYAEAAAGVFSSSSIDGEYTFVKSFRPNDNMSRDDNLFKDDDGKAYFVSAANENADLIIYELTDDYLDMKKQLVTLWKGSYREAPAIMKDNGRYFLVTSGATGWDPNQAKYATATSMAGPWTSLTNLGNDTAFDSQSTFLIPVQGSSKTTYVFAADRWQDPDLKGSKYIWLPLKVNGSTLALDWVPDWQLNLTKGTWSAMGDDYLPQDQWKLVSVDSEETEDENGRATNAFDDSTSTIWHTAYGGGTTPGYPHEIQIDLGASYALTAFRYMPRQDKDENGIVKDYEFYVSEDKANWGAAVASGAFANDRSGKRVTFTQKTARYVRFVAKSEINGGAWASMAELDLVGTAK